MITVMPVDQLYAMLSDKDIPLSKKLELLDEQEEKYRRVADGLSGLAKNWRSTRNDEGDHNAD